MAVQWDPAVAIASGRVVVVTIVVTRAGDMADLAALWYLAGCCGRGSLGVVYLQRNFKICCYVDMKEETGGSTAAEGAGREQRTLV